jgi:hypothetical protein
MRTGVVYGHVFRHVILHFISMYDVAKAVGIREQELWCFVGIPFDHLVIVKIIHTFFGQVEDAKADICRFIKFDDGSGHFHHNEIFGDVLKELEGGFRDCLQEGSLAGYEPNVHPASYVFHGLSKY